MFHSSIRRHRKYFKQHLMDASHNVSFALFAGGFVAVCAGRCSCLAAGVSMP